MPSIHVRELTKEMTFNVSVHGMHGFRVRRKIGLWLVGLGVRIIGCKVHIEE